MTEQDWPTSTDPAAMLEHVRPKASDRKLQLFSRACLAIIQSEAGCAGHPADLLREIFGNPFRPYATKKIRPSALGAAGIECKHGYDLCSICDAETTPFGEQLAGWLTWNNGTIPKLAQAIYDDRDWSAMPVLADALEEAGCREGAILQHCREKATSDCDGGCQQLIRPTSSKGKWMLYEDAGPESRWLTCPKCNGSGQITKPIIHVRGCWVLDLLLGKS